MKKVTMITLAALTVAAPSFALAQGVNVHGANTVKITPPVVSAHTNAKVVLIDGPDRNHRPDMIIVRDDDRRDNRYDDRRDYRMDNRYDYRRNDFYRHNKARYYAPTRFMGMNKCGIGAVSYRLPNGRFVKDNVYMCQQRNGDWVVANR